MKRTGLMATLFLLFFLCSHAGAAEWGRGRGGPPGQGGDFTAITGLNLTAEQINAIKALRQAHLTDIRPLQDKMMAKREELKALWLETSPNREKIAVAQEETDKLRMEMHDKIAVYRLSVYRILTPEQQEKVRSAVEERTFRRGPRWGRERQDRPGMGWGQEQADRPSPRPGQDRPDRTGYR